MKALRCGDKVPASGVYQVSHLLPHPAEQREMYFEGSHFPACKVCAGDVYYRLESLYVPMAAPAIAQLATAGWQCWLRQLDA
jgi:hypothetical protein